MKKKFFVFGLSMIISLHSSSLFAQDTTKKEPEVKKEAQEQKIIVISEDGKTVKGNENIKVITTEKKEGGTVINMGGLTIVVNEGAEEEENENNEQKSEEIKFEGKVFKKGNDFFLKTANEELKLPQSNDKNSKIKLEDLIDKSVNITAKGFTLKNAPGDEPIAKHEIKSIKEIKLANTTASKKEEKK